MNKFCAWGNIGNIQGNAFFDVKFWTFEGGERVTETEQVGTRGDVVLILFIGDNVVINVYHEENQKLHQNF